MDTRMYCRYLVEPRCVRLMTYRSFSQHHFTVKLFRREMNHISLTIAKMKLNKGKNRKLKGDRNDTISTVKLFGTRWWLSWKLIFHKRKSKVAVIDQGAII